MSAERDVVYQYQEQLEELQSRVGETHRDESKGDEHRLLEKYRERVNEGFLKRFLTARNGDVELAYSMIIHHLVCCCLFRTFSFCCVISSVFLARNGAKTRV